MSFTVNPTGRDLSKNQIGFSDVLNGPSWGGIVHNKYNFKKIGNPSKKSKLDLDFTKSQNQSPYDFVQGPKITTADIYAKAWFKEDARLKYLEKIDETINDAFTNPKKGYQLTVATQQPEYKKPGRPLGSKNTNPPSYIKSEKDKDKQRKNSVSSSDGEGSSYQTPIISPPVDEKMFYKVKDIKPKTKKEQERNITFRRESTS